MNICIQYNIIILAHRLYEDLAVLQAQKKITISYLLKNNYINPLDLDELNDNNSTNEGCPPLFDSCHAGTVSRKCKRRDATWPAATL